MVVDSFYNFKDKAKYDPDVAQKWGALAVKLTEKLDKLERDTNDKKNLFEDISFNIKQGSGGSNAKVIVNMPHLAEIEKNG